MTSSVTNLKPDKYREWNFELKDALKFRGPSSMWEDSTLDLKKNVYALDNDNINVNKFKQLVKALVIKSSWAGNNN